MSEDFFAPPPFQADAALAGLKRELRALRLTEREGRFELQGRPVASVALDAGAIAARLVKRPAQSPDWEARTLGSAADVRRFADELKRRLAGWGERDD
jgi:hypothetical protein